MYYCRITQNNNIMKKTLYLFLVIPLIFSSCEKEEDAILGCTDLLQIIIIH